MKKNLNFKPSFTQREMNAIAAMLLSSDGINVDPIIEDMYPQLSDEDKSMFRCKIALLLKGNMPEFVPFTVFRRVGNSLAYMYRVEAESSLLGTYQIRRLQKYTKNDETDSWNEEVIESGLENIGISELEYYSETLDEALKSW